MNECAVGYLYCDQNADCIDRQHGFLCVCKSGFNGDGKTCARKNSCVCVCVCVHVHMAYVVCVCVCVCVCGICMKHPLTHAHATMCANVCTYVCLGDDY